MKSERLFLLKSREYHPVRSYKQVYITGTTNKVRTALLSNPPIKVAAIENALSLPSPTPKPMEAL